MRRQECYTESIERSKLSAHYLATMGKIQGTLRISRLLNLRAMQIGDHALGPARASQRLSICRLNRPVLNMSEPTLNHYWSLPIWRSRKDKALGSGRITPLAVSCWMA